MRNAIVNDAYTGGKCVQVANLQQAELFRSSGRGICAYAVLAAATMLSAAPAFAQGGGFAARPSGGRQIDVRAVGSIEYNDNVVLNDPRISGGGKQGDVIFSPSLNMNILLPRATGDTYLAGSIGYRFFSKYSRLNRENITLTGGADQRLASCLAHGEVNYRRSLGDLANLLATDVAQSFRNTEETRRYSADIGCGSQYGLRPSVAYSRTEIRNSLVEREFADADTDTFTGQLGLPLPAIGTVSVFGRASDTRYIHRPTPTGARDGAKSYAAGVQLERTIGTRLNFRGSVNYTKVDPKLAGTRSFSGIGFDLASQYNGEDFSVQLSGSRVAEPSAIFFVAYNITTMISASVTKQLSERVQLSFNASRSWRDFASSPVFVNAPVVGNDSSYSLGASATYTPVRRLSFILGAGYTERSSNVQLFDFRAKRVTLTTSLAL